MNKWPRISVVTPSFNQAKFIKRTIDSVLSQKYPDLEYIVMDGGSNDGTVEILKKYDNKIIWRSEKDKGQGDAINKGLKLAKGEILAYLNSDDTLEPGALKLVADFFVKNPKVMWVFGKCRIIDENDREVRKAITTYKNFWLKRYNYKTLLILDYISQPAVFWRRRAYEEIGEFDIKEFWELDYDYWLRLGKKYKPGFIDKYLANFRVHKKAKTSIGIKHFLEEVEVAKKYTKNPILIGLHYLNFLTIVFGYSILSEL
ncbi:MAG: glycosyltransferase family 2 protein [Patescibacteria group bacterium]